MSPSPDMTALYNRPIVLWVEDLTTRAYLTECWSDPDIGLLIAGGHDGIRAVVRASRGEGHGHVFGFADRDFGYSNRPRWLDPAASPVLVPEVHEVENYLLDPAHLAGCGLNNGGRSEADILTRLQTRAAQMVWWMAFRRVLTDLRAEVIQDFPPHAEVRTQADAERLILTSPWFTNLAPRVAAITAAGEVTNRLTAAHGVMAATFASGDWRRDFSGKTLVHDLHDWLYHPPPGAAGTATARDRDLARSVAQWQVANSLVPQEVRDLRAALRHRVGLPP